jgi:hypothetical protein
MMGESDTVAAITQVFKRLPANIDLRGATSAFEIERRMNFEVERLRALANIERQGKRPRRWIIGRLLHNAENIDKLIETDWPSRFVWASNKDPKGVISRTLYGKEEARVRAAEARRRAIAHRRAMIYAPRAGVRPLFPRVPPVPETRRMRAWRK